MPNKELKHTPVPWSLDRLASPSRSLMITTDKQLMRRTILMDGDFLSIEDAQFIVIACNSYPQMLIDQEILETLITNEGKAINEMKAALRFCHSVMSNPSWGTVSFTHLNVIENALKSAGEEV